MALQSGEAVALVLNSGVELSISPTPHIYSPSMAKSIRLYFLISSKTFFFFFTSTVYHFRTGYQDLVVNNMDKLPMFMEFILQRKSQQTMAHGSNPVH